MNLSFSGNDLKSFWIAFIVSAILSKPILNLLIKAKSRQTVSSHLEGHAAKQGTPTMGGFIILVGMFAGSLTASPQTGCSWLLVVGALFAVIGFVDDYLIPRLMPGKRGLGWKQKIMMQIVAAVTPLLLAKLDPPLIALGTFSILFFANAFNFADGLDGLAGTVLLGQLLGIFLIPQVLTSYIQAPLTPFAAILGGLLVFLFWNAPKARVFMGDVGSLPIGAMLGAFWVFCVWDFPTSWLAPDGVTGSVAGPPIPSMESLILPVVIWSIPMICELVPVPLQVFSVKVFKKKLFPFTPIHHAFEEIKLKTGETEESESYLERVKNSPRWAHWPETRIVFTIAIFQLLCSMLAITVALMTKPN
jgi:phospho-N-acetylmuramoyl-pentapeptide-transferase